MFVRLEHALRKFTVLTAGQRIPIIHDGRVYPLKVEEIKPSPASHLIDTNLQVEFVAYDEMKAIDEEEDTKALINGHNIESKEEKKDDIEEDEHVDVIDIPLYTTVDNTAKYVSTNYQ